MKTFWELKEELNEAIKNLSSADQVKAAIKIIRDKRFNMRSQIDKKTAIEKISKDLLKNPEVKKEMAKIYEEKNEIAEISQKTLDNYMKKAGKQYRKAADKMGSSDKAKKTFDKRHKGIGSVFKRDAAKKRPEYIHKPSMGDRIEKGTKGHSLTTKPASKLAKAYKDR